MNIKKIKVKNENRSGYKKTKVGWIPEEWAVNSLIQTISKFIYYRGQAPRKTENE